MLNLVYRYKTSNTYVMKTIIVLSMTWFLFFTGVIYAQPTGTIIAFAGPKSKIFRGWVVSDGTLYDRTSSTHSKLFSASGTSWGGDGSNKFAVPDLRGLFLRGVPDTANVAPEKNGRLPPREDLRASWNGGNQVGSKQDDAFEMHKHEYTASQKGVGNQADGGNDVGPDRVTTTAHPTCRRAETRPKNAYVYYTIKL
jgi:microcystin-dependent protein